MTDEGDRLTKRVAAKTTEVCKLQEDMIEAKGESITAAAKD